MNCLCCEYARRAENEDYIGCIKMLTEPIRFVNYTDIGATCDFYERDSISVGYVNLGKRPENTSKDDMITGGIPCFKKTDICKYFKPRGDINASYIK